MGLGPYPLISLADARERARVARLAKHDRVDPLEQRRQAIAAARVDRVRAMTFRQAERAYFASHRAGWSAAHASAWSLSIANHVDRIIGDLPVAVIDTAAVMSVIGPLWSTKTETASRIRGRIELVLGWAETAGYRPAGANPARWKGHLQNLLPARSRVQPIEHFAALPFADIGAFMRDLRALDTVPSKALEFCILTAARTAEVVGARWEEINIQDRVWTVPASRMKAGKDHRVPLSDAAVAIVKQMAAIRQSEWLFPGHRLGQPIGRTMLTVTLARVTGRKDLTVHGFRSSFRDWCAETQSVPREVVEMALAHAIGNAVEAAYRRGDLFARRRKLAEAWAKFCLAGPVVVPLRNVAPRA
jgi:integrase